MSYIPAELDDDFDNEDGFLGDYDDALDSNSMGIKFRQSHEFESQSQTHSQSQPSDEADQRHVNFNQDPVTVSNNNTKLGGQKVPTGTLQDERHVMPQSNSIFPSGENKHRKQTSQYTIQVAKSSKGSSLPPASFVVQSAANILTEEDFKVAIVKGNVNIVQKCIRQGFAINQVLPCGWTPFMYACNHSKSQVVELLLKEGADPSYHVDMYTPLMCACSSSASSADRLECVKILVLAGVDVNARDRHHSTALMLASRLGYLDLVEYLIEKGAKVNEQDSRGWTALTWSVQRSQKHVAIALLESGGDCNIKHSDRLTVKDMAAHMPTDEMLALLERRPVVSSSGGGDMTGIGIEGGEMLKRDLSLCSTHSILDDGDNNARSTDLRYGEMEIFLLGLDLPHLVSLFQKQLIDLYLLLDMTNQDLIDAGVEQVGARKKILDATRAVHKKNWEGSSLVSVPFNKQICCSDALAMVANASKHIRYIASTVVYINQHLKHHPHSVIHASDRASPRQLVRHVADTSKHVQMLSTRLCNLQNNLIKEMKKVDVDPPDLIPSQTSSVSMQSVQRRRFFISCGLVTAAAGLGYAWRNGNLTHYLHTLNWDRWHALLG